MSDKSKITYQIEFFSDWHLGSGLSVAGDVDAAVLKDDETGLPYIPGKTLKGLLRHAAEAIRAFQPSHSLITETFVNKAFGLKTSPNKTEDEDIEEEGQCFFSNAYLTADLQESIEVEKTSFLYRKIASTAIDKNGIAKMSSLRKTEVTIPLVLNAYIADADSFREEFKLLFKMVKRMGLERHRGLGRCEFSIVSSY